MDTLELKSKIIGKIRNIKDNYLLEELYRLINTEEELEIYLTSDGQKESIKEAQEQVKSGIYLTEEQADKDIEECLKK
jgi:hypothetical protein